MPQTIITFVFGRIRLSHPRPIHYNIRVREHMIFRVFMPKCQALLDGKFSDCCYEYARGDLYCVRATFATPAKDIRCYGVSATALLVTAASANHLMKRLPADFGRAR